MIPRYSRPEMAAIFSDRARMARWLEVELLAAEGWAKAGVAPAAEVDALLARAPRVDDDFVARVNAREQVTDHDLAAFVDVVQAAVGGREAAWVHYGLTSSDVVDTALAATLTQATDLLLAAMDRLVGVLVRRAHEFASTPIMGRTHGMHAEPTTFGAKLALWALQGDRDRQRLRAARRSIAVGKLSGAVGTYSNIDPVVEGYVCSAMGLVACPATQVIARDRHAELLYAIASIGASIETYSTEIRHLQRSEVREVQEPFRSGQKGSSAMPHKRNPITSERLSGLARVLRGYLGAGLENVALWHERDISHSSVERVILPDACLLGFYMIHKMADVLDGLVVYPERMLSNIESSLGLVFSQPVLLALVSAGVDRDTAYRIVQRDARAALETGRQLRSVLEEDDEVSLSSDELEAAFSLTRSLRNVGRVMSALDNLEVGN